MKTSEVFPSRFLKAEDLDHDVKVVIESVKMEKLKDPAGIESEKPCIYFKGKTKGLICNKTNWKKICQLTGEDDTDNWTGKEIVLTVIDVDAFGDVVSAIRVKSPTKSANPAKSDMHDIEQPF